MKQEAVFAIIHFGNGMIAATTRPNYRQNDVLFGLPGGKVDVEETHIQALDRECKEEGWGGGWLSVSKDPFYSIKYNGTFCHWYVVDLQDTHIIMLSDYKEKDRGIIPAIVHYKSLVGLHNEVVLDLFFNSDRS